MRTVLRSVQDANQQQGKKEENNQAILLDGDFVTPRSNQRKAVVSPPGKIKKVAKRNKDTSLKSAKKISFEEQNKENIPPETPPIRYSKRVAGEDISEETKFLIETNPQTKKELGYTPPVKFPHRFEKTPDVLTVVIQPKKDVEPSSAIEQDDISKNLKSLKNYQTTENFKKVAEKMDGVRLCETAEGIPLPKSLSVKMACCKAVIYAKAPEQHNHHFGEVQYDESVMRKTLQKIKDDDDILLKVKSAPETPIKNFDDVAITRDVLRKWEYKAQEPRSPSQCGEMGMSAGEYVQLFGFEDPHNNDGKSNWEWLHLIAFSLGGPGPKFEKTTPQDFGNLFAGTSGANTWMMLPENLVRYLLIDHQKSIQKVFVSASAELFPGTHIAKKIHYTIKWTAIGSTEEKSLTFKFNPLRYDAPPKIESYLRGLVDLEVKHKHPGEKVVDEVSNQNNVNLNELPSMVGFEVDFCGLNILTNEDQEPNSNQNESELTDNKTSSLLI